MSIVTWLKQAAGLAPRFPRSRGGSWLMLNRTAYNYAAQVKPELSSIVEACIKWVQRTFPEAPMMLEQATSDGWQPVYIDPALDLLNMPNPYYDGGTLWQALIADRMLTGNAYILKVRSAQGRVVQLWWLPASTIEPRWPESDASIYISHYEYKPDGLSVVRLDPKDVIHLRDGLDPANVRKGLSPIQSLFREIFTDDEAANMTASLMRNMGVPGLIISPEDTAASREDLDETKKEFMSRFTGDKRGEPLVMGGPTKVTQFGYSPQQMDLKLLRQVPEERVSAVLGIPAIVAGLGAGLSRSTFANYAEARESAYESHIIPLQRSLAAQLRTQYLAESKDSRTWRLAFDLRAVRVLQEDENQKAARIGSLVAGGMLKVLDGQRLLGIPVDDTQDFYLRPLMLIEVPSGSPRPEPEVTPTKGETISLKRLSSRQRTLILRLRRDKDRLEAAFAGRLTALFRDLGQQAATVFRAQKDGGAPELKQREEIEAERIVRSLNLAQFMAQRLGPLWQAHYLLTARTTFATIADTLGVKVFLDDPIASRILGEAGKRMGLLDLSGDTRQAVFQTLTEGRDKGESMAELANHLKDKVGGGRWKDPQTRAEVIARTETNYAQGVSSIEGYKESGVVRRVMILDAQLGPTDEECEEIAGAEVSFEESLTLLAQEHPNGTRNVVGIV